MIVGLRGRRAFAALRREGVRGRAQVLDVLWRGDAGDTAARRVAFAVGRQVGTAVVRNRVKRRLRAALVELERADDPRFAPGDYLVRAHRGADQLSYAELRDQLVSALDRAATRRSGAGR